MKSDNHKKFYIEVYKVLLTKIENEVTVDDKQQFDHYLNRFNKLSKDIKEKKEILKSIDKSLLKSRYNYFYNSTDEQKLKRKFYNKKYNDSAKGKAYRKAYNKNYTKIRRLIPEVKQRYDKYQKEYKQNPEYKKKIREKQNKKYAYNKQCAEFRAIQY
jgi:hypothetical protein